MILHAFAQRGVRVTVVACTCVFLLVAVRVGGGEKSAPAAALFHVAPDGDDAWSGTLPAPNAARTDGPFATLERARDGLRALRKAGQLRGTPLVQVRGGVYVLREPFQLEPRDSGEPERPTVFAAASGERPVFSGGRRIDGWKPGAGPLWQVIVPGARQGQWFFHQLFVNGERRQRARIPNAGYLRTAGPLRTYKRDRQATQGVKEIHTGFKFQSGDLRGNWRNPHDINLFLYHSWTSSLHWLDRVDTQGNAAHFTNPCGWPVGWWENEQRYFVEHVREGLDAPGEWYLDRTTGLLEYYPLPGEDMTKADVIAPVLTQLLLIDGRWEDNQLVHDVTLRGLSFQHADWSFADTTQAVDGQAATFLPGAVQARGAQRVALEDCEIAHVGSYALYLESGCKRNRVMHCELRDFGGGGVRIGETMRQKTPAKTSAVTGAAIVELTLAGDGARDTGHNVIDNNWIHDGGHVFPAGVGVLIGHSAFNEITHNEICDLYYSAVSVGWVWGFGRSAAHHNRIADNHLHHIGWGVLSDMGGVYSLGPSPGTVVAHNLVHDVCSYSYGGWGLYTDEGSSEIVLENNVVYDTKTGGFHQHYGRDNVIRNNIFAFSRKAQIQRSREDVKNSLVFERNLVFCDNDQVLTRVWKNGDYKVDRNVYWSTATADPVFAGRDWEEWRATSGQDQHSLWADPRFVNAAGRDFRLQPDSPAAQVGFEPIDLAGVGLYGEPAWTEAPRRVRRPEFPLPATAAVAAPGIEREGFENTNVGEKAVRATTSGEGNGAAIRVTDKLAASGHRSLQFTDAPGLAHAYQPLAQYAVNLRKGVARAAFDLRVEPGAVFWHEWRDAAAPYRAGPSFRIEATGDLTVGGKKLTTVPHDRWIHIEIACGLGPDATGTYDLTVTVPGQAARTFAKLPIRAADFRRVQWFGFISMATQSSVFYLDNVYLGN